MSPGGGVRVRALSFHASYRCRSSGACCSSGWPIPVEPGIEEPLGGLPVAAGPALVPAAGLPHGARVVLRSDSAGRCALLRSDGLCAVHAQLGEAALPVACRQFPRVVTLTPLGVSVTLSHYCPTAAALVISSDGAAAEPVHIVPSPPVFPASWPCEGLDARGALPPLLRPGVLMTWAALERWEHHAVATLTRPRSVEAALAQLVAQAERARRWTPADGDFDEYFASCHCDALPAPEAPVRVADPASPAAAASSGETPWALVASTVAARALLPRPPVSDPHRSALVDAGWPSLAGAVGRWLAARAFASWLALQGDGLRTTVLGLHVALGVLRSEAGRGCAEAGRPLDAGLLREAVRRADLLLLHLADPEALARRLSRCETAC